MKTLAYHSPFLPERSGISVYSHDLLFYLKEHFDITLISDNKPSEDDYLCICYEEFDKLMSDPHKKFDYIIYNIGNNIHYHKKIYKYAMKYPGVVILHDFFISDFMYAYLKDDFKLHILNNYLLQTIYEYFYNPTHIFVRHNPLNKELLQSQKAVIVHTKKALELAKEFYGNNDFLDLVPHLRINEQINKQAAKEALNLTQERVYGVFGFLHPIKQNLEILKSWARVMSDKNARLFLIGGSDDKDYEEKIKEFINSKNITNISLIGWADKAVYEQYLSACDVCICLRKEHKGEASGAILDCMNYQNTIITNFSGFDDYAYYIPSVSDDGTELDELLLKAYEGDDELAKKAKEYIKTHHDPKNCAKMIFDITQKANKQPKNFYKNRILFDISSIAKADPATGRVVWQQLNALLQNTTLPIIPIYFDGQGYSSANEFLLKKLALPFSINDEKITPQKGDIYYCADFSVMYGWDPEIIIKEAHKKGFFTELKKAGGEAFFLVHDLLPLTHPEFFPYHASQLHLSWCECLKDIKARLIAISNRVKNDLLAYGFEDISVVPHGINPKNFSKNQNHTNIPTFICVGTIEERKGIKGICLAFEHLALEGIKARLIVVGRMGRVDDDFKAFLESGEHENIIYKGFCADDELNDLYASSHALIAASYDEGFGLPLIEGGLPVIARDIEVFREVLGDNALYFKDNLELMKILQNYKSDKHLAPPYQRSWGEVANVLLRVFGL